MILAIHRRAVKISVFFVSFVLAVVASWLFASVSTHAVSASDWQAGRIIDDDLFTLTEGVTAAEIQAQIKDILPPCDRNGTQPAGYYAPPSADTNNDGIISRAEYGAHTGNPAPFTCLDTYRENPNTGANNYGKSTNPPGSKSAAQLIVDAGKANNISPRVLLVMLRKESTLLQDNWPFESQFDYAMGAYCPDGPNGANCDPNHAGFAIQINDAAELLRYYLDNMDQPWWSLKSTGTHNILWNTIYSSYTNSNGNVVQCGGKNVNIQTKATAALYTYTPYQPNSASLNAYPAAVPSSNNFNSKCASYGNRNFWYMYNDMFGSTIGNKMFVTKGLSISDTTPNSSTPVTGKFTITNYSNVAKKIDYLNIAVKHTETNEMQSFAPGRNITINPGKSFTFTRTKHFRDEGPYYAWITSYHNGEWSGNFPESISSSLSRNTRLETTGEPILTKGLALSSSKPKAGDTVTATFDVKNYKKDPITLDFINVAVYNFKTRQLESFTPRRNVTIAPDTIETFTFDKEFSQGEYRAWITSHQNGVWSGSFPKGIPSDQTRAKKFTVTPNPLVTSSLSLSKSSPKAGDNVTASFNIKNTAANPVTLDFINVAVWGIDTKKLHSFTPKRNQTIQPGQTFTFNSTNSFPQGRYRAWITSYQDGVWSSTFPNSSNTNIQRTKTFTVSKNPQITTGLSFSDETPSENQDVTATFKVKNSANAAVSLDYINVAVYSLTDKKYYSFTPARNVTINSNQTYTFSATRNFPEGDYRTWITSYQNGVWSGNFPKSSNGNIRRAFTFNVN